MQRVLKEASSTTAAQVKSAMNRLALVVGRGAVLFLRTKLFADLLDVVAVQVLLRKFRAAAPRPYVDPQNVMVRRVRLQPLATNVTVKVDHGGLPPCRGPTASREVSGRSALP